MRIYLHELSDEPTLLDYTEKDDWVKTVIAEAEEAPAEIPSKILGQKVHFEFRKTHELVFMTANFDCNLGMICSRCAKTITVPIHSDFESLFTKEKDYNPVSGASHGIAYSAPTGSTGQEMEVQTLEKDYIELEEVLKEQVYLQLPVQPLCKEDCKGICATCGQDQNVEPCQCHRIKNNALANALRKFIRS